VFRQAHRLARLGRDLPDTYGMFWDLAELGFALFVGSDGPRLGGFARTRIPSCFLV